MVAQALNLTQPTVPHQYIPFTFAMIVVSVARRASQSAADVMMAESKRMQDPIYNQYKINTRSRIQSTRSIFNLMHTYYNVF